MEQIFIRVIESSVSAALLMVVLWVFLPRLLRAIDALSDRNTREHEALILMLTHVEMRMNWHEARVYGINPSTGLDDDERMKQAVENFSMANAEIKRLRESITRLFRGQRPVDDLP